MDENGRLDEHQKFKELSALAHGDGISEGEWLELKRHLQLCHSCQDIYKEYALISREGMPFLAATSDFAHRNEDWDDRAARNQLLSRVQQDERIRPLLVASGRPRLASTLTQWTPRRRAAASALAASVLVAVAAGAYDLGGRTHETTQQISPPAASFRELASGKEASDGLLASQAVLLSQLQKQISGGQQDIARLRAALRTADDRAKEMSAANGEKNEQFRQVVEQRDKLAGQLHDSEQAYQLVQAELITLRADHNRALLHTASLESKIEELTGTGRDQDRRLKDDEQYLASDRDIRELMGARKLYIADVFDVDSGSRTRKPFGRVFYTQNKSLIFYAFDLDHEPGVKNASAFQVWGQRDASERTRAMNLGILYMDSETNRRWVLHLDDPKQLAEIDAVFVTVEPHGGSPKPTGKPFLYALLRKEANHP